ncbi:MAG TPA: tetratricopeptide repeat protein [Gammaproteobacteria bacterium]|nr:tetratricopeptide repeat protein [Gammaproteobacteria bacterium]
MRSFPFAGIPLFLLLLLHGCATSPPPAYPPPVVEQGGTTPDVSAPPVTPDSRQAQPARPAAVTSSPAVVALLGQAENQANSGDLGSAAASLERAIRIEPRNPLLWYHLATVRLAQQEAAQAEQLATKSNALAAGNRLQQSRNWRLIARSRQALGDASGARAAERRARDLEGR